MLCRQEMVCCWWLVCCWQRWGVVQPAKALLGGLYRQHQPSRQQQVPRVWFGAGWGGKNHADPSMHDYQVCILRFLVDVVRAID
jgi:hypothetical protein